MNNTDELDGLFSRLSQRLANSVARKNGYGRATKVTFSPAALQPCIGETRSYGYETMGGSRIRHPSAYRKAGWSNMRYVHAQCEVILPADSETLTELIANQRK